MERKIAKQFKRRDIMLIPREVVEDVRNRNDIVDVISSYVNLKRAGSNYQGLCPFHNEKTPSFTVFTATFPKINSFIKDTYSSIGWIPTAPNTKMKPMWATLLKRMVPSLS